MDDQIRGPSSPTSPRSKFPACVQLRIRASLNLPSKDYKFVYVLIKAGHIRTKWETQRCPVANGSALINFWARIPADGLETRIELEVRDAAPKRHTELLDLPSPCRPKVGQLPSWHA